MAECYQDILIDTVRNNLKLIVENEHADSMLVLLEIMSTGCRKQPAEHLEDINEEKIRARRQTSLWIDFCDKISAFGSGTMRL